MSKPVAAAYSNFSGLQLNHKLLAKVITKISNDELKVLPRVRFDRIFTAIENLD